MPRRKLRFLQQRPLRQQQNNMVKASLKNYRQSPRKVRLVADAVRGINAQDAVTKLTFTTKKASDPIKKLIESAIANAKNNEGLKPEDLFIKEIRVDKGFTLYRRRARARGRAMPIRKRTSKVLVVLDVKKDLKKKVAKKPALSKPFAKPGKAGQVSKKAPAKKAPAKKKVAAKKIAKKVPKQSRVNNKK